MSHLETVQLEGEGDEDDEDDHEEKHANQKEPCRLLIRDQNRLSMQPNR